MRSRFFLSLLAPAILAYGPERLEKTETDVKEAIAGPRTPAARIQAAMDTEDWMPEFTRDAAQERGGL